MKSTTVIATVSALAASVWAQNMIPSDVSPGCKDFLTKLNADSGIANCLNKLVDATSQFDQSGNANVNSTVVSNTLNNICSTSFQACSEPTIRTTLANYYTACSNELLVTKEQTVIGMYDVLYLVIPMKDAICARNGSKYCLQDITVVNSTQTGTSSSTPAAAPSSSDASPAPSSSSQAPAKRDEPGSGGLIVSSETLDLLKSTTPYKIVSDESNGFAFGITPNVKRQDQNQQMVLPDADLYRNTSLPYLFISPTYTLDQLCTECTKQVIGSYVAFESVTPYALGIANSPILKGQLDLWEKLKQCPNGLANTILNDAIPNRNLTGSATSTRFISATFGVVLAAFGMGILSL